MRQTTNKKILIIGAGMGGLALALALQRFGIKVSIFETAPKLAEIGAGLSLSPNATHALNYIGLGSFLHTTADCPKEAVLKHYKTDALLQDNKFDSNFMDEFGAEYYQIHRADMHAGLVKAVLENDSNCIHLNYKFVNSEQNGKKVKATFANGETAEGDVLIGADGIRSAVRSCLIDEVAPVFTGQVAYRATLNAKGLEHFIESADSTVTIGPGNIFVRYGIRHKSLINVVSIVKSEAWKEEGWNIPASKEDLLAEHAGWNNDVIGLIKSAPDNAFYKWALFDRKPIPQWTFGRTTLLGDAAHPILPFLGMGAAMAFEDSVVLARCIDAYDDIEQAFMHYENARKERTNEVFQTSREHGQLMQKADPDKVDWAKAKSNNDWRYFSYNPITAEI